MALLALAGRLKILHSGSLIPLRLFRPFRVVLGRVRPFWFRAPKWPTSGQTSNDPDVFANGTWGIKSDPSAVSVVNL
jgi:hypothetical protein